jgi:hypothetical protein
VSKPSSGIERLSFSRAGRGQVHLDGYGAETVLRAFAE